MRHPIRQGARVASSVEDLTTSQRRQDRFSVGGVGPIFDRLPDPSSGPSAAAVGRGRRSGGGSVGQTGRRGRWRWDAWKSVDKKGRVRSLPHVQQQVRPDKRNRL